MMMITISTYHSQNAFYKIMFHQVVDEKSERSYDLMNFGKHVNISLLNLKYLA